MVKQHENPSKEQIEAVAEVMWNCDEDVVRWNELDDYSFGEIKTGFLRQVEIGIKKYISLCQ